MQRLQKVCEHEVIMAVVNSSLHTWHCSADSRVEMEARGVPIQSVGSGTESFAGIVVRFAGVTVAEEEVEVEEKGQPDARESAVLSGIEIISCSGRY